jgi:heme A synthase
MKPSRIFANLVGFMLFVQVILVGSATFGFVDMIYHTIWGAIAFAVFIVATAYAFREFGTKSSLFRVGVAVLADYVIQIALGFTALGLNNDAVVVVYLTNAFALGALVTYLISFADSADKVSSMSVPGIKAAP